MKNKNQVFSFKIQEKVEDNKLNIAGNLITV